MRRKRRKPYRSVAAAALALVVMLWGASEAGAQQVGADSAFWLRPIVVDTVIVTGNDRIQTAIVVSEFGIRAGDRLDDGYRDVQHAIHELWATGQFNDVVVLAEELGPTPTDRVALTIQVEERPYIAGIDFIGLQTISASTIRDTVGLSAGQTLQPSKVAAAEAMTRELLADEGIWLRSIEHRVEPVEERPGQYRLIFDVTEGQRVALADIEFLGNEVFSDERLREAMGTKPEGFLWFRTGRYDEDQLRLDLREGLPALYGERGYIDFAVVGDSIAVDPATGKARLVISVEEGPQYVLAEFAVIGNRRFSSEELERYFETPRGGLLSNFGIGNDPQQELATPFNRTAFNAATQQIHQLYNNYGYLYAQIEPVIEKTTTAEGRPAVEVAWRIQEGEPAYINRVTIVGNTYTHEDVIRDRLLVLPGDVYSQDALLQSYQAISGLGFFETPLPTPLIEPTEDGDVNITFEVEERQTGSINFGTAIGGFGGLSGFLGYDQPNLFGQAKSGHLRAEFGRFSTNFQASYTDPSILGSLYSGSASVFSRNNRFGLSGGFSLEGGEYRQTGTSIQFGLPLPLDRWTRATIGYSIVNTSYDDFQSDETTTLFNLPTALQSSLTLGLLRNTLNHTLFPTAGTRQQLSAQLNGGPLGGDGDFQKYIFEGSWYVPAGEVGGDAPGSRPIRFTLGLNAEIGAIVGDPSLFPFERYFMGGVQFGRTLRGYEETTITPLGYIPEGQNGVPLEARLGDAYLRLSAEYAVRISDNLSLSTFYDAGNVWSEPGAINPARLFRGAGLGVTLVTPFGPLGLDYAYGFDKTDPGWQLHFKMGPTF